VFPAPDSPPPPDAPVGTVRIDKVGNGVLRADTGGVTCDEACTAVTVSAPLLQDVTLDVTPSPGWYLASWSPPCEGIAHRCTFKPNGVSQIQVTLKAVPGNLVFATAKDFDGNLGGLAGADEKCAAAARDASLSGHYVALLSTGTTDARSRLVIPGTALPARGWWRLDGLPVFDSVDDIFTRHSVLYTLSYTSNALPEGSEAVWTGSDVDGKAVAGTTCDDFTSNSASRGGYSGKIGHGPGRWIWSWPSTCSETNKLYCFGVDSYNQVPISSKPEAKKIFVTRKPLPMMGRAAGDALCESEKPPGSGTVKALISTTDMPASAFITPDRTYVRPDGIVVGTGAELIAAAKLSGTIHSGIWQHGDGSYAVSVPDGPAEAVWIGFPGYLGGLDSAGTLETTCSNWTSVSATQSATVGEVDNLAGYVESPYVGDCTQQLPIYCVEE
jgi:hypothetical protein